MVCYLIDLLAIMFWFLYILIDLRVVVSVVVLWCFILGFDCVGLLWGLLSCLVVVVLFNSRYS